MKKYIPIACLFFGTAVKAQIPEDALKYGWNPATGSARISAIGGAMGSLGGDISATHANPAGLAFYKTTDVVLSPGFNFLNNKSLFRGTSATAKENQFNLGTSGIVGGWQSNGRFRNKAASFAVTRTANFNNRVFYQGQNNFSSQAEQYAAELAGSGIAIDDAPGDNRLSLPTRLAIYNYVIDTATLGGNATPDVISRAMFGSLVNGGDFLVDQSQLIETSGGITEIAVGYAANKDDKFYIGGSIGLPIVRYEKKTTFRETDATGDNNNDFNFNEVGETFNTKGMGVNLKLGMIVKPAEFIRLGLAVHTPTWYSLEDSYGGYMSTDLEGFRSTPGTITTRDRSLPGYVPAFYRYELMSPWKFMVSGSYVLREIEDVTKQKGFISADIEYVTYKSNKFRNSEDYEDDGYYESVNETIKDYYGNAFNFRVGGELKFTTIMTRLGFSYYGNPYADAELKANRMFISGGLGYRNAGIFIDLTYVHGITKDVNFPYRLPDKANTFANTKTTGSNIMLTLGFKI